MIWELIENFMKDYSLLTNKEQKTYEFIEKYSKKYGRHPLLNEIETYRTAKWTF